MMKKIIFFILIFPVLADAANFIDPLTFKGTDKEKRAVIAFVQEKVAELQETLAYDSDSIRVMLEQSELDAFKKLLTVEDKALLKKEINEYCSQSMFDDFCTYDTLLSLYQADKAAKGKKLTW